MATIRIQHEDFNVGAETAALTAGRPTLAALAACGNGARHRGGAKILAMTLSTIRHDRAAMSMVPPRPSAASHPGLHADPSGRRLLPGENIVLGGRRLATSQGCTGMPPLSDRLAKTGRPVLEEREFRRRREPGLSQGEDEQAAAGWGRTRADHLNA